MKITLRLIISLLIGTALVVLVFSYAQMQEESRKLSGDLDLRARLITKTFKEALEPFLEQTESPARIKQFLEKFRGHQRLIGITVQLKGHPPISLPDELASNVLFQDELFKTSAQNEPLAIKAKWDGKPTAFHTIPLEKDGEVVGSLGVVHDKGYITSRLIESLKRAAVTFSALALILSITTLVIVHWSITGPIAKIAEWAKKTRMGEAAPPPAQLREAGVAERLLLEIRHMASSLKAARLDLIKHTQEKHLRDSVWSKGRLKEYLKVKLKGAPLFVVANREPYIHQKKNGEIKCIVPASGVVTSLDPVMQATGGVWVAHGSGSADRETVDERNKVQVPPWRPAYALKRVWLNEEEEQGYYYGFSNEGLWPLCHIAHVRPVFRISDWEQYQKVNKKFADALLPELPKKAPLILIQDYHFALLPKLIKEARPDAKVALFWHIPWPNPEAFGICPWQEEILEGMLGSDIIGFHTQYHCNNFLDTVDRFLESRIDWTVFGVTRGGKASYVRPFPISVAFSGDEKPDGSEGTALEALKKEFGLEGMEIGVGVDRIDYTKGLLERFRTIERTFEKYPQHLNNLVFVELGAPSRTLIPSYQNHLREVDELVEKINSRFGSENYKPILFLKDHHSKERIREFYKIADFCMVSSLHDGMNLVAKEFVASRSDGSGVLIVSQFAGASQEFWKSALVINPYDIERSSDAVHQAITMLPEEKQERMKQLRTIVQEYNVYRWASELVTELAKSF